MLQGITNNGEMKNVKVDDNGAIQVVTGAEITEDGAMKVAMEGSLNEEVVLNSSVLTIGTTASTILINKKITEIMVANYSDEAIITITADTKAFQIGANLALELPINAEVENLSIVSTTADTKVQLVVKGVE